MGTGGEGDDARMVTPAVRSKACRACIPCHDYAHHIVQVFSSDQNDQQTGKASAQDGQLKAASVV